MDCDAGKARLQATRRLLRKADEDLGDILRQADEQTRLGAAEIAIAEASEIEKRMRGVLDASIEKFGNPSADSR